MTYSHEQGRQFWLAFDQHFKFEAGTNGLGTLYGKLGGYNQPGATWYDSIVDRDPSAFESYGKANKATLESLADAQHDYFQKHFGEDMDAVVCAFQDFAFGILASPTAPNRGSEPIHTMNGGRFAPDYLSWQGFIEALLIVRPNDKFWQQMRWMNGMAWELQARAAPQEAYPNTNQPLSAELTNRITEKWRKRTGAQIAEDFGKYLDQTRDWDRERAAVA